MTKTEARTFIEEMRPFGDRWTEEEVIDIYGTMSLEDALANRRQSVSEWFDMLSKL